MHIISEEYHHRLWCQFEMVWIVVWFGWASWPFLNFLWSIELKEVPKSHYLHLNSVHHFPYPKTTNFHANHQRWPDCKSNSHPKYHLQSPPPIIPSYTSSSINVDWLVYCSDILSLARSEGFGLFLLVYFTHFSYFQGFCCFILMRQSKRFAKILRQNAQTTSFLRPLQWFRPFWPNP